MGDERDSDEDSEAILRRREALVRRAIEDAHRSPPGVESRPMPCLSPLPDRAPTRRGGARPWVWIAAAVFTASVAIALLAVRLLQLI